MLALLLVTVVAGLTGIAHADAKPQIFVAIASSHDESPEEQDTASRDANRETVRAALLASLATSSQLTSVATMGIEARRVDLSVVALHATEGEHGIELSTELRIVISDATGKILSVVTGGARAEVSRRAFGAHLRSIKKQLLEDAVLGMFAPLRTHLLRTISSC